MTIHINPDPVVTQELAERGVDSSVGVFGSHYVKIGKASPIRLDQIQSASAPYAGVWTAVQIRPGLEGVRQTAEEALRVLLRRLELEWADVDEAGVPGAPVDHEPEAHPLLAHQGKRAQG